MRRMPADHENSRAARDIVSCVRSPIGRYLVSNGGSIGCHGKYPDK
jgi:hypothetical protein